MYNSDYTAARISFSNDFVERSSSSTGHGERTRPLTPPSSDFEFSVTAYSMLTADQLFSKGKLLPYRETATGGHPNRKGKPSTLIFSGAEDGGDSSGGLLRRNTKGGGGWKGLLGLKRRSDRCEGGGRRCTLQHPPMAAAAAAAAEEEEDST